VAEVLRAANIGYVDRAGNCWLQSSRDHLLIERQGFASERRRTPAAADPFSPKSSRIVRLLLTEPHKGWQVRELAKHPDVEVSPGLVVKVKRALAEEGYAVERDGLLFLRDPSGLLSAWSKKFSGPAEQLPLYFRGDPTTAEREVHRWCRDHSLQHAVAGFSAAWRLAPEVRYSTATVYVEERGLTGPLLDQLCAKLGAKQVSTGANLLLWRPFDHSVFSGGAPVGRSDEPVTSPLQTYLDAQWTPGRGEEAAVAIFQKHFRHDFDLVADREEEKRRAAV
jgi:hypothetical protein